MEGIEQTLHIGLHVGKLLQGLTVIVGQLTRSRHLPLEIFIRQDQRTVDEVTQDSHQLIVIACLEIFPSEVIIFCLRCIGGQHVAQYILFTRQVHQILMQPNRPVARGRDLIALQVQELIGGDVIRHVVTAVCLHHHGEDQAVEHDVILTDEVNHAALRILPPFLPRAETLRLLVAKFLCIGDIANRCVKPDVEHLTLSPLDRYRNTPIQVAGHRTRLQIHV